MNTASVSKKDFSLLAMKPALVKIDEYILMNKELYFRVGKVFTPNAPVGQESLFAGRTQQLKSLRRSVTGLGSHAVVFGDRGVGKTSLGFHVFKELPRKEFMAVAVSCDRGVTYSELWRTILERVEHASGSVFDPHCIHQGS